VTITAEQVIDAARDEHPAFSPQRFPPATLLRQLERYHKRLAGKLSNVNSSVLAVELVIDLLTFDFVNGLAFPANLYVLPDGEVEPQNEIDPGDRAKFVLIGQNVRLGTRPVLSGWFIQNQFYLNGDARNWAGFLRLHMHYTAEPVGPVALADNFDPMPDEVEDVLVARLAMHMAKRGHIDASIPPIDKPVYLAEFADAEQRFLEQQGEKKKARLIKTQDVFPF
jgi:hypothetical protein